MQQVLADLYEEHRVFLAVLGVLEKMNAEQLFVAKDKIRRFLEFVEHEHHGKEENLLFPIIDEEKVPECGGANCILFFGPRVIDRGIFNSFDRLKESIGYVTYTPIELNSELRSRVFAKKSMLTVPMEDHILGSRAAKKILDGLDAREEGVPDLLRAYASFLRDHIEREDRCLFLQVERLKTPKILSYTSAAEEWDAIRKTKKQLNELRKTFAIDTAVSAN